MPILSISIALLSLQSAAPASPPADAAKKKCKSEQTLGSRMRKRVCRTEAEWEELEKASQNGQPQRPEEIRGYR